MPKLPGQAAADAKKAAQGGGREALEEGTYAGRLTSVIAKPAASSGNPMWVWEFEVIDEPYVGRKLWVNTVLTEKAMWKVGEMFNAFGVPTDTDTDELIGETCLLQVSQQVIQKGARTGQMGNNVDRALPTDETAASMKDGGSSKPAAAPEAAADTW
jgi:hypothetical protein